MANISEARVLIVSANGFEQSELEIPRDKLRGAGATVQVASPGGSTITGWDKDDWGRPATVDLSIADAKVDDYEALVLPGGQINPDLLRIDNRAMSLIRAFLDSGKPVAAVCHAPWLLIEAGAVKGREATSYPSIRTDMENAGAIWKDEEVVVSDGIITSRNPGDLDAFVDKIIEEIEEGRHRRAA
ncbi:type 1 glutamine amidotransferase domain-containing protein [Oceanibacterium hippocampi]|uniref:General stress protein 18 n=1 Tax=Oceanibacterium hippocampi TaxID=745714 RepID=A0A1Y5TV35_9PROT|nr:type 1 glutamine amidotransferase domain-containing protein [Oceanibacterium hippocampi]SLN73794.1 General stress protein 18 [Oceanibacterium hippocampi]